MKCSVSRQVTMQATHASQVPTTATFTIQAAQCLITTKSGLCICQKQIRKSVKSPTPNGQKQTPDSYLIVSAQMSQSKSCTFKVMQRLLVQ